MLRLGLPDKKIGQSSAFANCNNCGAGGKIVNAEQIISPRYARVPRGEISLGYSKICVLGEASNKISDLKLHLYAANGPWRLILSASKMHDLRNPTL